MITIKITEIQGNLVFVTMSGDPIKAMSLDGKMNMALPKAMLKQYGIKPAQIKVGAEFQQ